MSTLVRAIKPGFANGARKRVGAVFPLADGVAPGHWMEVVEAEGPKKTKAQIAAETRDDAEGKAKAKAEATAKQDAELRNLVPAGKPDKDLV